MSILQADLPGAWVTDLFAGTGALGLEALSRGAAHAEFVEEDVRSLAALERNIAALNAGDRCTVRRGDVFQYAQRRAPAAASPVGGGPPDGGGHPDGGGPVETRRAMEIVFADPPYRLDLAARLAELWLAGPFATILGVEHEATATLPDGGDRRRYGDTAITIYRR